MEFYAGVRAVCSYCFPEVYEHLNDARTHTRERPMMTKQNLIMHVR